MTGRTPVRLPSHWSRHVKAGILHAISLASVVLSYARGRATARRRLEARLEQATAEIALLREELAIKDDRRNRSHRRRRPHYSPTQRMRILQLRAARGWTLEETARVFLVDLHTLMIWMRRLDEDGDRAIVQTFEPVNRYPDFVRNLVRQLEVLCPAMGSERMAYVLATAGLALGATTIRRTLREPGEPPGEEPRSAGRRRRVVAKYAGHTWHVDLTTVPTRAGFWTFWLPVSLPQRWPFCWRVAVAVDQLFRASVGFAVFGKTPSSSEVQRSLERTIRARGRAPRYIVSDKGKQFWCRCFKNRCRGRGIRPRYGRVGEPARLAIAERFIRSLQSECTRLLLMPMSLDGMRRELGFYATWYNPERPYMALGGKTSQDVWAGRDRKRRRFEPRPAWPRRRHSGAAALRLVVSYLEERRHLPVIELRRAA